MRARGVRRLAMLAIAFACIFPWSRCGAIDHDVDTISRDHAGSGAIDCGFADGNAFAEVVEPAEVRACMSAALNNGQTFYGSASPASADGGTTLAYTYDGETVRRVTHDYSVPVGPVGCYREDLREEECIALVDRGDDCGSAYSDLCFTCTRAP